MFTCIKSQINIIKHYLKNMYFLLLHYLFFSTIVPHCIIYVIILVKIIIFKSYFRSYLLFFLVLSL